jgi:DNA-binding XRE family transcriptional regulator
MGDVIAFRSRTTRGRQPRRRTDEPARRIEPARRPGELAPSARPPREELWRTLVGDQLRAERRRRGETQAEVAGRAGISVQYLSELERGRKEPSSEVLAAAAGALQLTLLDLTVAVARELHAQRIGSARPTGPVALAA